MPSGTHSVHLNVPIETVWNFVSEINQWAPLAPGYIGHEMINDSRSIWTIVGDTGIVQKSIKVQVDIIKWEKPFLITFQLTGINENITGKGFFKARVLSDTHTKMTGNITLSAHGIMGPMINAILNSIIQKVTAHFTEKIATEIKSSIKIQVT